MRRRFVAASVVALALPASALAATARVAQVDAREHPTVRVTVVTSKARAVPPALTENGRAVTVTRADNLGTAKSVVLAVDRSRSMKGESLARAVDAVQAFVKTKPPRDRVSVVAFGSSAVRLTRFSTATIDADLALGTVGVDGRPGTALYDAVALAAQSLATESMPSRVLVLVTDGNDVSSAAGLREAVRAAQRAGVAVHAIGIEGEQFSPAPLRSLARATGGSYYAATSSGELRRAYARVGNRLRRTWRLEYLTAARPGDRVTVGVEGTRTPFVVPGTPASAPGAPSKLVPDAAYGGWGTFAVGGAAGGLLLLSFGAAAGARGGSRLKKRLAPHVEQHTRVRRRGRPGMTAAAGLMSVTEKAFGKLAVWKRVHRLLERADVPLRTVEFFYVMVGGAFAVGLLAAVTASSTIAVLLGFAFGASLPLVAMWAKARRRLNAFENQLPDLLLTIAASLKAGHSFKQGLQTVADEGNPPASMEFQRALAEVRLGRPVEDALRETAERVNSKNLEFVITAVTIQSQVGGSLAGLFDMVADAVRQRQQFARKIKGLTAMGRASAWVLIGLPFFMAAVITLVNGEYMAPLWTTSAGRMLVFFSLGMMVFGSLLLKKIVSFRG